MGVCLPSLINFGDNNYNSLTNGCVTVTDNLIRGKDGKSHHEINNHDEAN